jgi:hypothetical protein
MPQLKKFRTGTEYNVRRSRCQSTTDPTAAGCFDVWVISSASNAFTHVEQIGSPRVQDVATYKCSDGSSVDVSSGYNVQTLHDEPAEAFASLASAQAFCNVS